MTAVIANLLSMAFGLSLLYNALEKTEASKLRGFVVLIPVLFIVFVNSRIALVVKRHRAQIRSQEQATSEQKNFLKDRKVWITMIIIVGTVFATYFPFYIITTYIDDFVITQSFLRLIYLNSLLDVFIYVVRIKNMRNLMVKNLKGLCGRNKASE